MPMHHMCVEARKLGNSGEAHLALPRAPIARALPRALDPLAVGRVRLVRSVEPGVAVRAEPWGWDGE